MVPKFCNYSALKFTISSINVISTMSENAHLAQCTITKNRIVNNIALYRVDQ